MAAEFPVWMWTFEHALDELSNMARPRLHAGPLTLKLESVPAFGLPAPDLAHSRMRSIRGHSPSTEAGSECSITFVYLATRLAEYRPSRYSR